MVETCEICRIQAFQQCGIGAAGLMEVRRFVGSHHSSKPPMQSIGQTLCLYGLAVAFSIVTSTFSHAGRATSLCVKKVAAWVADRSV